MPTCLMKFRLILLANHKYCRNFLLSLLVNPKSKKILEIYSCIHVEWVVLILLDH